MLKIPHLKTAQLTPIFELEKICLANQHEIEHWFREKWLNNKAPFYGSVDLRNSNYKLTPIDMNLFSGGFNNINQEFITLATHAINNLIERYCPHAAKVLLIPENHTRNLAYLKNVYTLNFILEQAGLDTRIGSLSPEITQATQVHVSESISMTYYPIKRDGNRVTTQDGFDPCLILLNNDLSAGSPSILENIQQKVMPPLNAGWHIRKKTHFFTQYDKVCDEFAKLVNIDPWTINAFFDIETGLEFTNNVGLDRLAIKVDNILEKIRIKYKEHDITDTPYVIVKANNGTYGMGIMSVKSGDEIININRKSRNKMAIIKDGQSVTDVIIQEGVYSFEKINGNTAEPVIYMMGCSVIGGFYRVNARKGIDENLNSVGASFVPMSLASKCLPS
ncbi:MAG: glutamate--cysteine ligase, partial [Burkholderiales bacterium]|nr:glutamate--cysteine ligase [Burkholderiales bacterium]